MMMHVVDCMINATAQATEAHKTKISSTASEISHLALSQTGVLVRRASSQLPFLRSRMPWRRRSLGAVVMTAKESEFDFCFFSFGVVWAFVP
jgi:hypothetical protein